MHRLRLACLATDFTARNRPVALRSSRARFSRAGFCWRRPLDRVAADLAYCVRTALRLLAGSSAGPSSRRHGSATAQPRLLRTRVVRTCAPAAGYCSTSARKRHAHARALSSLTSLASSMRSLRRASRHRGFPALWELRQGALTRRRGADAAGQLPRHPLNSLLVAERSRAGFMRRNRRRGSVRARANGGVIRPCSTQNVLMLL